MSLHVVGLSGDIGRQFDVVDQAFDGFRAVAGASA
jgi:hypothetical protein